MIISHKFGDLDDEFELEFDCAAYGRIQRIKHFNDTISGTEFYEFKVLDLIVVLAASKVEKILLMVLQLRIYVTFTSGDTNTINNKYVR